MKKKETKRSSFVIFMVMDIIKRILKEQYEITESRQTGLLYHSTHINHALKILESDELIGSEWGGESNNITGVSTSRNKLWRYDNNTIQFVLDGDKLSANYKIRPNDYWGRKYNVPDNPQTVDEDEEIILTPKGSIKNISRYIVKVNIIGNPQLMDVLVSALLDKGIPYSTSLTEEHIQSPLDFWKEEIKKYSEIKPEGRKWYKISDEGIFRTGVGDIYCILKRKGEWDPYNAMIYNGRNPDFKPKLR